MKRPGNDNNTDLALTCLHVINFLSIGSVTWNMFKKDDSNRNLYNIIRYMSIGFGVFLGFGLIVVTGMRIQNILLIYFYSLIVLFGMLAFLSSEPLESDFDLSIRLRSEFVISLGGISMLLIALTVLLGETDDYNQYVVKWN